MTTGQRALQLRALAQARTASLHARRLGDAVEALIQALNDVDDAALRRAVGDVRTCRRACASALLDAEELSDTLYDALLGPPSEPPRTLT